jgi:hypothetical protein
VAQKPSNNRRSSWINQQFLNNQFIHLTIPWIWLQVPFYTRYSVLRFWRTAVIYRSNSFVIFLWNSKLPITSRNNLRTTGYQLPFLITAQHGFIFPSQIKRLRHVGCPGPSHHCMYDPYICDHDVKPTSKVRFKTSCKLEFSFCVSLQWQQKEVWNMIKFDKNMTKIDQSTRRIKS